MCKKHGKPILPCYIRKGSKNVGCSDCVKEWNDRQRNKRVKEFNQMNRKERPLCKVCEYSIVPRSLYLKNRMMCYACFNQSITPAQKSYQRKYQEKHKDRYRENTRRWRRENPERAREISTWASHRYRRLLRLEERLIL